MSMSANHGMQHRAAAALSVGIHPSRGPGSRGWVVRRQRRGFVWRCRREGNVATATVKRISERRSRVTASSMVTWPVILPTRRAGAVAELSDYCSTIPKGQQSVSCVSCHAEHPIGDSDEYLEDAELGECACPCSAEVFEITVGVSLYDESDDVRWLYLGCRCVACEMVAVYGDWKNEFEGYQNLLARV